MNDQNTAVDVDVNFIQTFCCNAQNYIAQLIIPNAMLLVFVTYVRIGRWKNCKNWASQKWNLGVVVFGEL